MINGNYQTVFTGTTIGRKKIAIFQEVETNRLRLKINAAKAIPILRNLTAYHIENHLAYLPK
jgi:alpha-L-fucosidase